MPVEYDKHYKSENLFGSPYPKLIEFYSQFEKRGRLLDVGCGQGRDAIALARMGYEVIGLDYSQVGIEQMNQISSTENLALIGQVIDIFKYSKFHEYDFILFDSMFHFGKKERIKEVQFIERVLNDSKPGALITNCLQAIGSKIKIYDSIILDRPDIAIISRIPLTYAYKDKENDHNSVTSYEMITIEKL